jgi:phenylacetate-coenzyme A ligase PaaK-like adenylate-forming protein
MTVATTATNAQMQALRLMRELRARDGWSREQLVDLQRERLRALVRAAVTNSAYYREALGPAAAGGEVLLEELPTLPKETLLDEFDRIVTDPRLRLDDLEAHAAGPDPARSYLDRYRVFSTSGTTGLRGLTVFTEAEFAVWVAANLRALTRIGITPGTRLAAIGAPSPLHLTRQLFAAFQAGRAGAPRLSVLTPLAETLTALNGYLPEALIGYPSIAGLLAQEQLDGRLAIAPRFVGVGGEVLTAETKAAIREAWGVEPADVYAATEAPIIASSIPGQPGLWIAEDLVVVEVVDEANRPVPPGTPGFKVLVTNLVNHAQPLIRYELSDSAVLADDTGPGALPYGRITRVDGRSDDILRFPAAGGGGEVAVHPYRLRAPVAELREVRQYQIVRDDSGLCVRLVLQPSAPRETTGRVWEAILAALHAAGAAPPPVRVTPVHEIPREPGHAAKLKLIVDARAAEHAR